MDNTESNAGRTFSDERIDQRFDLLLQRVEDLDRNASTAISSGAVAPIVDEISEGQHQTRIHLSRAIEEYITSWKPGDEIPRLRYAILAGIGLQNSTTERGVKSITRKFDGYFTPTSKGIRQADHLTIIDAIAKFYREYPHDFFFGYLENLFRISEPSSFQIAGSLAAIMLGVNENASGRLKLTDVVDTLFSANDIDLYSEDERIETIISIIDAFPTKYWATHLHRLDGNDSDPSLAHRNGRIAFLRHFLLAEPPVMATFSIDDTTYIVRPRDLLRAYDEGQPLRVSISSCADRLREPTRSANFSDQDSKYQELLRSALEHSREWRERTLSPRVVDLADFRPKSTERSR